MDKNFFAETEQFNTNDVNNFNTTNSLQIINDTLVSGFLNKTVSLESLIEKEIYKTGLHWKFQFYLSMIKSRIESFKFCSLTKINIDKDTKMWYKKHYRKGEKNGWFCTFTRPQWIQFTRWNE